MVHAHELTESCESVGMKPVVVPAVEKKTGGISGVLNLLFYPLECLEFEAPPGVSSDVAAPLSNGVGGASDVRGQGIAKAVVSERAYETL